MKIVQMISGPGVNGAVIQCFMLCKALHDRGHEVIVVGRPATWIESQCQNAGIPFVHSSFQRWPLDEFRRMAAWLKQFDPDVVHTHNTRAQLFGTLIKAFVRVPVVATAHHTKIHFYWRFNDFVIANSELTYRIEQRWNLVPKKRIKMIRCLVDDVHAQPDKLMDRDLWRSQQGFTQQDQVIGIVGDVVKRKNHLMLVEAMPAVLEKCPQAKVAIIGNDHHDYTKLVRAEIDRLGLGDAIRFTGYHDDIGSMMRALDLLVACPIDEPFGLTPPEAMAASKPVVASKVGGLIESVADGKTGFLVPNQDRAALADSIVKVLSNDELAKSMGNAGRARYLEMFDNEQNVSEYEQIYRDVCQKVLRRSPASHAQSQKRAA